MRYIFSEHFHKTAKTSLVMVLVASFMMATVADAAQKTFIREYRYRASDKDSKVSSRNAALDQVTALLLKETGAYVESTLNTEKRETDQGIDSLTTEDITAISAGVTKTQILEESWDGTEYYVKAEIQLDPDDIRHQLGRIQAGRQAMQLSKEPIAQKSPSDVKSGIFEDEMSEKGRLAEMRQNLDAAGLKKDDGRKRGTNILLVIGGLALIGGIVALAAGGGGSDDGGPVDDD
ncbi:MAG: hypothetical protein A3K90_02390 [Pelodictyon luteolum]|uniref:Uncharacterized protein n=1 Tax=Pelodictyon luteolum TaxID=1100 RepID=A0A165LYC9_PELLU|nr:hypothetical protein [Pelodictyon luteolum]KZK74583.1 MAG: hypothetical protein A3K90_02390 [Pelodictyon luteolum]